MYSNRPTDSSYSDCPLESCSQYLALALDSARATRRLFSAVEVGRNLSFGSLVGLLLKKVGLRVPRRMGWPRPVLILLEVGVGSVVRCL